MFQIKAKLLYNKNIKVNYFHCVLEAPKITYKADAGQFVNIRLSDVFDPLLRRPFSIHRVTGASIEILYEVVGRGSGLLSEKKAGEYLDVIGPLGNGFSMPDTKTAILAAGGMGVAPLLFLAEQLRIRHPESCIQVLIGAKAKDSILCEKQFKELGCNVKIATDDGSRGFKGRVTDLLKNLISAKRYPLNATIYACGPRPMLKEITILSQQRNIAAQISLEEHMACGIGACLGCIVNTKESYKRVCKDGPVFNAQKIIW